MNKEINIIAEEKVEIINAILYNTIILILLQTYSKSSSKFFLKQFEHSNHDVALFSSTWDIKPEKQWETKINITD